MPKISLFVVGFAVVFVFAAATSAQNIPQDAKVSTNPASTLSIYLDWDGHNTATNLGENGNQPTRAFSLDADYSNYSALETNIMRDVTRLVGEYFSPFNVNVTSIDPGADGLKKSNTADTAYGVRVNFDTIAGTATGMGYVGGSGGFATNFDITASLVDAQKIYNLASNYLNEIGRTINTPGYYGELVNLIASTVTHEVGHNLGLDHDGKDSSVYYSGHSIYAKDNVNFTADGKNYYYTANGTWSPIMGNDSVALWDDHFIQWSNGDYTGATNQQDDLAIISMQLGYRDDEQNGWLSTLTQGIIATSGDFDDYRFSIFDDGDYLFSISSGIDIDGKQYGSLYYYAELLDSNRDVVNRYAADIKTLLLDINTYLTAGDYFLRIGGSGYTGSGSYGSFSDYGSLGTYTIAADWVTSSVPEPATMLIIGLGLVGLGLARRRR